MTGAYCSLVCVDCFIVISLQLLAMTAKCKHLFLSMIKFCEQWLYHGVTFFVEKTLTVSRWWSVLLCDSRHLVKRLLLVFINCKKSQVQPERSRFSNCYWTSSSLWLMLCWCVSQFGGWYAFLLLTALLWSINLQHTVLVGHIYICFLKAWTLETLMSNSVWPTDWFITRQQTCISTELHMIRKQGKNMKYYLTFYY